MGGLITIFSIPKPFAGHIGLIQRNALASWRRLGSEVEVVLFGTDAGVAAAAAEFGCVHVPDIPTNKFGTPLVSSAFAEAARRARAPYVMYANADMLFGESLLEAAHAIQVVPRFLLSGLRWDSDITHSLIGASDAEWRTIFQRNGQGRMHGPAGMDYFLLPAAMKLAMPELAVGRVGWDSWLVWHCRSVRIPVVDATAMIVAVHQNHDYSTLRLGRQHEKGPERDMNISAAGGLAHMLTLREADWHLVDGKMVRPPLGRRFLALAATWRLYQLLLAAKRKYL